MIDRPPVTLDAPEQWPELLTAGEVAGLFRVDARTAAKWAQQGRLRSIRTLGGHHRFPAWEVRKLLAGGGGRWPAAAADTAEEL